MRSGRISERFPPFTIDSLRFSAPFAAQNISNSAFQARILPRCKLAIDNIGTGNAFTSATFYKGDHARQILSIL